MADRLPAIREAIGSIVDDDHVSPEGGGYRVTTDDGMEFYVHQHPIHGDWRVFFGRSTADDLHPPAGLGGTSAPTAEQAILWVLL